MSAQKNIDTGNAGEALALSFLRGKNYEILKTNWRIGKNEIDIIAMDNAITVFVEVKARVTDNAGHPEQSVTKTKQKEIKKVAQGYLDLFDPELIRFDVIAITFWPNAETEIIHFEDAFF